MLASLFGLSHDLRSGVTVKSTEEDFCLVGLCMRIESIHESSLECLFTCLFREQLL